MTTEKTPCDGNVGHYLVNHPYIAGGTVAFCGLGAYGVARTFLDLPVPLAIAAAAGNASAAVFVESQIAPYVHKVANAARVAGETGDTAAKYGAFGLVGWLYYYGYEGHYKEVATSVKDFFNGTYNGNPTNISEKLDMNVPANRLWEEIVDHKHANETSAEAAAWAKYKSDKKGSSFLAYLQTVAQTHNFNLQGTQEQTQKAWEAYSKDPNNGIAYLKYFFAESADLAGKKFK